MCTTLLATNFTIRYRFCRFAGSYQLYGDLYFIVAEAGGDILLPYLPYVTIYIYLSVLI